MKIGKMLSIVLWAGLLQAQSPDSTIRTLAQLQDSIGRIMQRNHIPGIFLTLVSRDSVIWQGGMGLADIDRKDSVNAKHLFRLGSVSKSFAAVALMQLAEQGKIDLNASLRQVAPEIEFENPWEATDPVRVIHLLEHASGFDDMHFAAMVNRTGKELSTSELVRAHSKSLIVRWRPGTRYAYSNPGYVIATYLIEKASGQTYHDYIREHVFDPIGMTSSNFNSYIPDDQKDQYAKGYDWEESDYDRVPFLAVNAGAAGSLNSNAEDMAKFVRLFLNDGRAGDRVVLSKASIDRMEKGQTTVESRAGSTTGYGIGNYYRQAGTWIWMHGHSGGIDGFGSIYGYDRDRGFGYALSNNGEANPRPIVSVVADFLAQNHRRPDRTTMPLNKTDIDPFVGYYRHASSRNELFAFLDKLLSSRSIYVDNDTVRSKPLFDPSKSIFPAGNGLFYDGDAVVPDITMALDESGRPVLIDGVYFEKISAVSAWAPIVVLGLSLFLAATYFLYSVIWLIRIRRLEPKGRLLRLMPLLANISIIAAFFILDAVFSPLSEAGMLTWKTAGFALSTAMFFVLSIGSLYLAIRHRMVIQRTIARTYIMAVSGGLTVVALYLFYGGIIGKCFWLY